MREDLHTAINSLAIKALIFSFLCHFLIFRLFVITFATPPVPHQPSFVFLGSILQKQDLLTTYAKQSNSQISLNASQFLLTKKKQGGALVMPYGTNPVKPTYTSFVKQNQKMTLKSNFEPNQDLRRQENLDKILGIETKVQPFVPLRLNPQ